MDEEELIGLIIDVFEDDLKGRDTAKFGDDPHPTAGVIPLHFEDEDSSGVFYGGNFYDNAAGKIKQILKGYGLLK